LNYYSSWTRIGDICLFQSKEKNIKKNNILDHRGRGEGSQERFDKCVHKNAIKTKIGTP
jgi:hypothetical protein